MKYMSSFEVLNILLLCAVVVELGLLVLRSTKKA